MATSDEQPGIFKIGVCNCTNFQPGDFDNRKVVVEWLGIRKLSQPYHFQTREIRIPEQEHDATLRANLCHCFLEGRMGSHPETPWWSAPRKLVGVGIELLSDTVHQHHAGMTVLGGTLIPVKSGKTPAVALTLKRIAASISASWWLRNEDLFNDWLEWMKQENIYPQLSHLIQSKE